MPEGKSLRLHSFTGLSIQAGTLKSLGVDGSPRTPILVLCFFYQPSDCPTQLAEEGPQEMRVWQALTRKGDPGME